MAQLKYRLSGKSDKDYSTTVTHLRILIKFLLEKGFISSLLTTMCYHMDGCAKQQRCAYDIYLLSCISLGIFIIIDRALGASIHGKYVFGGMNARL